MKCMDPIRKWFAISENKLLCLTVLAVILGCVVGFTVKLADPSDTAVLLISFPGEILMRMLNCIILPMIISSIISSLVQMDSSTRGRLGGLTVVYYVITTTLAVAMSVVLVMLIGPGYRFDGFADYLDETDGNGTVARHDRSLDTILDLFRHIFTSNIFGATIRQQSTIVVNETTNEKVLSYEDNPNVVGIVAFCVCFGFVAGRLGEKGASVAKFFIALEEIIMTILMGMIWFSPIGILSLVAGNILEVESMGELMKALGWFIIASLSGLMLHFFVVLPIFYFVVTRRNPYKFLFGQFPAWVNVLGPSSSSAALPITSKCLMENNGVDARVALFVLPMGATINIDGAALYEAMAAVFVAQLHRMPLSIGNVVAIILTVTLSSVGSSSLPGAGLVSVLPVLAPIPVTSRDVAMLISVDWFIDRIRTCNNVMGDSIGAGMVDFLCRKSFSKISPAANGEPTDQTKPSDVEKQDECRL